MKSETQYTCKYFDTCTASICPLSDRPEAFVWFADDGICRRKKFAGLEFIKTQKKIAKKTKRAETCYTYNMLNRHFIVRPNIEGLDPDKFYESDEKEWLKKHPVITKEDSEKRAERFKQNRNINRTAGLGIYT